MLTQANMIAHTVNAHEGFEFDDGDKNMVSMPLFHVGGSSYVLFGIHDGIPSVMTRDLDGAVAGRRDHARAPTARSWCRRCWPRCCESGPDAVKLFGALKTYTYGASPMPLPLLRAAMEAWPDTDFIQVYGLTELCGVITHLHAGGAPRSDHPERLCQRGHAGPGRGGAGSSTRTPSRRSPPGEQGEMWFRTPQLMKGYLNKPEATAEVITEDGWFRTGDIGRVDDDGYVFVEDRLKDMIISGGENIYSTEVERVLAEHPAVVEVAVIGVPDEKWGEAVKAVVSLEGDRHRGGADRVLPRASGRLQVPRRPSTSWTSCRATRPARSSRRICASRTGRAATAPRSNETRVKSGLSERPPRCGAGMAASMAGRRTRRRRPRRLDSVVVQCLQELIGLV